MSPTTCGDTEEARGRRCVRHKRCARSSLTLAPARPLSKHAPDRRQKFHSRFLHNSLQHWLPQWGGQWDKDGCGSAQGTEGDGRWGQCGRQKGACQLLARGGVSEGKAQDERPCRQPVPPGPGHWPGKARGGATLICWGPAIHRLHELRKTVNFKGHQPSSLETLYAALLWTSILMYTCRCELTLNTGVMFASSVGFTVFSLANVLCYWNIQLVIAGVGLLVSSINTKMNTF